MTTGEADKQAPFTIYSMSPELWSAYAVFNPNAFPNDVGSIAHSCAVRLALLLIHSRQLSAAIDDERKAIAQQAAEQTELLLSLPKQPIMIQADGIAYTSALYSVLNTTKSFLDVYAKLMGKLISGELTWTFKSGNVANQSISGGGIIKSLRASAPKSFQHAEQLAQTIFKHSTEWITTAVAHRDKISHHSEITGFRPLWAPLAQEKPCFREELVFEPVMPGEIPLRQYGLYLQGQIKRLLAETLPMLPRVNHEELVLDKLFK